MAEAAAIAKVASDIAMPARASRRVEDEGVPAAPLSAIGCHVGGACFTPAYDPSRSGRRLRRAESAVV